MKDIFEIAAGSVAGRMHRKIGKNNQDAYGYVMLDDLIIGAVCDGCGSGKKSEFGSELLAASVLKRAAECSPYYKGEKSVDRDLFWQMLEAKVLADMGAGFELIGPNKDNLHNYFLAALLGFIINPRGASIFSIGDGLAWLNGSLVKSGEFAGNAPPYLSYRLLPEKEIPFNRESLSFDIIGEIETEKLETLMIATDGADDLLKNQGKEIPGKTEKVGEISQWWENGINFSNPDMVRRRLSLISQDICRGKLNEFGSIVGLEKTSGLLPDDTTLLVLRRKKGGENNENQAG